MKTTGVQVWSCGGGTQSGAIAVLIGDGTLPISLCRKWTSVRSIVCLRIAVVLVDVLRDSVVLTPLPCKDNGRWPRPAPLSRPMLLPVL